MDPRNVDSLDTASLTSKTNDDVAWTGGFFAYGGEDTDNTVVISFVVPPGKRLGRHYDTAEETQFILGGSGDLLRDDGAKPIRAGDVVVLKEGVYHDLHNTGSEDLHVIGFFASGQVEQRWSDDVWEPGDLKVTGSPNR